MIKNMTIGSPSKILWSFSVTMLLSSVFQQCYNLADSVIVGRFDGDAALAAVGASYPVTMIFMAVGLGANIGAAVVFSQLFGAGENTKLKTAVSTGFFSVIALAAVLTIIGAVICNPVLKLLGTPKDIFADSDLYLRIYIYGLLFLFLYNMATSVFTALGDSKTPLFFLIGSSITNIVLDYIFVAELHWGVAGVAWATFIAQAAACILVLLTLYRRMRLIAADKHYKKYSFSMLKRISKIAIPSILQQSFVSVGNLLVQGAVNSFGTNVISGYAAAIKLNTFAVTSMCTIGNSISSFTAQNMGAKKFERIHSGFKISLIIVFCVLAPFVIFYTLFSGDAMHLFLKDVNKEVFDCGEAFLKISSPFYLVLGVKIIADGALRGAGEMRGFMISTFVDLIIRVVGAYALAPVLGTVGMWMCWPIGWVVATVISLCFYLKGKWRKKLKETI